MSTNSNEPDAARGRSKSKKPQPGGRDDVDLFIDEVTEELQKDRAYALFRRYGPYVGGAIVLIVLAASVNEYVKSAAIGAAREAGGALLTAAESAAGDEAAQAEAYAAEARRLDGGPSTLASFYEGALRVEDGAPEAAASAFDTAAAGADDPIYRDLAVIRATLARFGDAEPDALIAALSPLAEEGRPYRPAALELMGLADLRAGREAEAVARFEAAAAAPRASEELRRRVRRLIEGVGGARPSG